jgi:hypothetical protein
MQTRENEIQTGFCLDSLQGREHFEEQGMDVRIMYKRILKYVGGGDGLDSSGSEWGLVESPCEKGNEPSGSIKCGEFLDKFRNILLLKTDSAPCT